MSLEQVFRDIYNNNIWNDHISKSGTGSNLQQTKKIRSELPGLFRKYEISMLLDIPCGDFYWMKEIRPELGKILTSYSGADLVDEIVSENNLSFSGSGFSFTKLDIINSRLPRFDAILCRDCLVHFSYKDILKALTNIKESESKYLLTTTFPTRKNRNIISGNWMTINLQRFPFYFPEPIYIFSEECDEFNGQFSDKSLALWEIEKINLFYFKTFMVLYSVFNKVRSICFLNAIFFYDTFFKAIH